MYVYTYLKSLKILVYKILYDQVKTANNKFIKHINIYKTNKHLI